MTASQRYLARAAACIVQRYQSRGPPRIGAAMPAHAVGVVIGRVPCYHAVRHVSSPPAATAAGSMSGPDRSRWHAHEMIIFDDQQHGCDGKRRCSISTVHGPRPSLSAAHRSTRTSGSLADCPAGPAGASAARAAALTSRCRGVDQSALSDFSESRVDKRSPI